MKSPALLPEIASDPASASSEEFEVITEGLGADPFSDDEMIDLAPSQAANRAPVPPVHHGMQAIVVSSDDDIIPVIKASLKRRAVPTEPSEDQDSSDAGEPSALPCGRSRAATRIKGRGFLFPPPRRASVATQASDPCPFQAFKEGSSQYEVNDPCLFWMTMGRCLFADSPAPSLEVPTDSVESYEVMRHLDYDIGIPADNFLRLFDVCLQCSHVMTRYWAEDHPAVCPARDE